MQNPALSSSLLDHSYPSAELLGAAVFQGQGPPRVTVVPWKVSEQASLLLFILRVCNFTSRGQCRSRQCHTAHPSGRNLAQEGVLLASLTGKEDRGQRVRAAGQTGTVWGSQGEGSLLPPQMQFIISCQLLPEARGSEGYIPCNPSEGGTLSGSH